MQASARPMGGAGGGARCTWITGNPRKAGCRAITPADGRCSLPPAPHVGPYGTRPPPCRRSNGTPPVARGAPRRPVRGQAVPRRGPVDASRVLKNGSRPSWSGSRGAGGVFSSLLAVLDEAGAAVAAGLVRDHDARPVA